MSMIDHQHGYSDKQWFIQDDCQYFITCRLAIHCFDGVDVYNWPIVAECGLSGPNKTRIAVAC